MEHEDLRTSETPQSRAGFFLKTAIERSPKTEFWVQWLCPYIHFECNPFTYAVGSAAAVSGFEGIHKSKEQLPNGQFFPNEKMPLKKLKKYTKKSLCVHNWSLFGRMAFNLID